MSKAQGKFDFSVHHPCNVNQTKKKRQENHSCPNTFCNWLIFYLIYAVKIICSVILHLNS